ncbi:hypothetical protein [Streptomyces sp. MBT65]|uniref:hypothetical protein n=1 Tax=Streptomyces sp. MBT65 TaxID=1488395 RepID=UPI0027DA1ADC|nr:hypothetical protein [Streptomyces sp. MBT65]
MSRTLPAVALLLGVVGCGAGGPGGGAAGAGGGAAIVRVPQDTASLRTAMERVRPGGLVLVSPGVYRESVIVAKPRVVVCGAPTGTRSSWTGSSSGPTASP